jgi:signal transduction histidine kinase
MSNFLFNHKSNGTTLMMPEPDVKREKKEYDILVIDDNPADATLVSLLLEESDLIICNITACETLSEGLDVLESAKVFQAVLLDLSLPDSSGFETLKRLLERFSTQNVIVLTGYADKKLGIKAVQAGAQDFLVKGMFDGDQLAKTILYAIERSNAIRHAEEMGKARDLAEESARMREQFIAGISHEMRTPMNAVLGMSNLLGKTVLTEEQNQYVHSIKQSSEILLGIINDILEISTIQNGKVEFEHKDFDLHELLANLINVMQYKINEKSLGISLAIDPNIPRDLKGDKLRLNQILFNLVGNAIKFTDTGYVKIILELKSLKDNQVVLYCGVEDTGIGIPADKLEAVFGTFTRIRTKDRLFEGTGLGLSIAKNLIDMQGGTIGLTSTLGEGSLFFFTLPFEVGMKNIENADKTPRPAVNPDQPINLLLVEDHKMNQLVARKTLEKHFTNIKIIIADNGQKAVDLLKITSFDLILMDIQMPVMDGIEATAHIRQHMPEHATLPILAMTAHANISKDEKWHEYGFNDYVLKPFDPENLFAKIVQYARVGELLAV